MDEIGVKGQLGTKTISQSREEFQGSAARLLWGVARVTRCAFATPRAACARRVSPQKATSFATSFSLFSSHLWPRSSRHGSSLATRHSSLATAFFSPPPREVQTAERRRRPLCGLASLLRGFSSNALMRIRVTSEKRAFSSLVTRPSPLATAFLACALLLFFLSCGGAFAQTETATISGLITDESGAMVVGADVQLLSVQQGTTLNTKTNSAGLYVFANVQPGMYQIKVNQRGFKQVDILSLIVNVQDHIEQNVRLQIGSVSESVTVNANDIHINTTDATVSTVVDRQFAENLPLNGRSFQSLIQLAPGVVAIPSNAFNAGQFSVNGQRGSSNYWMVDGVSANVGIGATGGSGAGNGLGGALGSFSVVGGTNSLVSVDAMQEFRIQTSTYAPEFGRTPGGQISIVTRSGTNQYHGTIFDYFRNDILDANNWFNTSVTPPIAKAKERQNDFGGTLGGPIIKDRTFFFFSYEGLRLRLPQTALSTVPCDSSCQVFGNARSMAVSAVQPYLNAYPVPNGPEVFTPCTPNVNGCPASGQTPTGAAQYNTSFSDPATLDAYSLRIDHRLGDRLNVFGRYNYSPSEIARRGVGGGYSLSTVSTTNITTQTATVGATWSFSPTIASDLRFNYSRTSAHLFNNLDSFGGAAPPISLPLPNPFSPGDSTFFLDIYSLQGTTLSTGEAGQNLQRQINIVGNTSIQIKSHAVKVGIDFRRLSPQFTGAQYSLDPSFGDVPSAEMGSLLFTTITSSRTPTFHLRNIGVYAQDTWRVVPRLTITYGLRWDLDLAPSSDPALPAVVGFNLSNLSGLALAPAGKEVYGTTYGNVAPRVGVAYQLSENQNWQTVLRGGFGVFYDLASSELGNNTSAFFYPFGNGTFTLGGTFPPSPAQVAPPPIAPPDASNGILFAIDPDLRLPYTLEWNVAAEQGIGSQQTLSLSYVGAVGRRLLQQAEVSPVNANLAQANLLTNAGTSDYDALQAQFRRRLSRGLQALASYTWSHSIDTASAGSFYGGANALLPSGESQDRGPSDFDLRHTFSAALTYDLPAMKRGGFTKALLGGWSTENIVLARSAQPVNISDAKFFALANFSILVRPDLMSGQPLYVYGSQYPGGKAFNPKAFTDPPFDPTTGQPLRQGNTPRNFLRGFGATQWDFAVHRDFPIHESLRLQFRAEMFNVLNHPNFGPPRGRFGSGGFGISNQLLSQNLSGSNLGGGGFSPLYQIGGPRSIQFALKLNF
jgi:Carboxypeptidase regulatory-like domain/TonB dependent receptor-like, beta-barrel